MNRWLSFSIRAYRWLLRLYPTRFRHEYESEMALVFRDSCRDQYQAQGAVGLASVWAETVPDLLVSVTDEHAQEDFQMTRSILTRGLAIAGLVGGALWVAFGVLANMLPAAVEGGDSRNLDGLAPLLGMAWLLSTLGMSGIYWRYHSHWSLVTSVAVIVAILGGLEVFICFAFNIGWPIWVLGWMGFGLSVLVGGLVLFAQPTERVRGASLIAMGLSLFLFNSENWLVLLSVVFGIGLIVLTAPGLGNSPANQSQPPAATA